VRLAGNKVLSLKSMGVRNSMAPRSEDEEILEMAIDGISRVAEAIAAMPVEDRVKAFEAVERSYCETALDLGYEETQAQGWAAALMVRLRAEVGTKKVR
jgi:hypothetical protein